MRFTIILIAAISAAWAGYAAGQKSMRDMSEVLSWLRDGAEFSYTLKISSYLDANPAEKRSEVYSVYTSGSSGVRYLSSNESCAFQGPDGQFRADLSKRKVTYRQYDAAAKQEFAKAISAQGDLSVLDSTLLKGARVRSRTVKGSITRYELAYDTTSMFRDMAIEYNATQQRLVRVGYSVRRSLVPGGGSDAIMIQNVEMIDYSPEKPAAVRKLLAEAGNLDLYLKAMYPGFTIHTL